MSTSALHKFVVYAPDVDAPDALQRRVSVRQSHLENSVKLHHAGVIITGGAMLTPESLVADADKKMIGSVIIYAAESLEAVRNIVESDIYYTAGVWDKEKLVIMPFVQASFPPKPE